MSEIIPRDELPVTRDECPCYKCAGEETRRTENGYTEVVNNMEYHTYEEPCGDCGTPRTKYRDLGRKGRYVCPNCQ